MTRQALLVDAGTVSDSELATASLPVLRAFVALAERTLQETEPELTLQQFRALTILHERGRMNATTLAAALGIAPSTLTRLANRLVRDDLVERTSDAEDRRAVLLGVTVRGARTAHRVKASRLRALGRQLGAIAPSDRRMVLAGLERCGEVLTDPQPR